MYQNSTVSKMLIYQVIFWNEHLCLLQHEFKCNLYIHRNNLSERLILGRFVFKNIRFWRQTDQILVSLTDYFFRCMDRKKRKESTHRPTIGHLNFSMLWNSDERSLPRGDLCFFFFFSFFLTIKMTPSLSSAKISLSIALFGHQGNSNMGFAATKGKYLLGE